MVEMVQRPRADNPLRNPARAAQRHGVVLSLMRAATPLRNSPGAERGTRFSCAPNRVKSARQQRDRTVYPGPA
jgi:hypothetical protein